MARAFVVVVGLAVIVAAAATNTIICGGERQCPQTIRCPQGANCEVDCTTHQSCSNRRVYCPDGYGCLVKCNYGVNQACQQTDIIQGGAKDSALSLLCNGPQACDQASVSGECDTPLCQVTCYGNGPSTCDQFTCNGTGCP